MTEQGSKRGETRLKTRDWPSSSSLTHTLLCTGKSALMVTPHFLDGPPVATFAITADPCCDARLTALIVFLLTGPC